MDSHAEAWIWNVRATRMMDAVIRRKEHHKTKRSAASANQADFAEDIEGGFSSIKGNSMSLSCMISGVPGELGGRGGNTYDK